MTNDWDFYSLLVDDEPASIFVDLGVYSDAPLSSHPYMAYIRLYMNQPRPDGLSSNEEYDALIEIEKTIEIGLCGEDVGYVGRNTSGGCRDFFFYISSTDAWESKVEQVLSPFKDYQFETATREDTAWTSYCNFLYPSERSYRQIWNRRVCATLEKHGDTLTKKREVDHWCYFQTINQADAYISEVMKEGFQLRHRLTSDEGDFRFSVQVWREDIPSYREIDDVTKFLMAEAKHRDGKYDGWECPVEV